MTLPTLADVAADPRLIAELPTEGVPLLLKQASALALALATRLELPAPQAERKDESEEGWVTASELGQAFGLSPRQIRSLARRRDWASIARRINRRTTR